MALSELDEAAEASPDKAVVAVVDRVAKNLGNTRAVCRKHYIHPALLESFLEGRFQERLNALPPRARRDSTQGEPLLLAFLDQKPKRKTRVISGSHSSFARTVTKWIRRGSCQLTCTTNYC